MRVNLLGPMLVLADDGTDLTPRGAQQRRLLGALAVASPDPVPFDALHELLWRGPPPSANALQALVSKLRRGLGVTIDSDGRSYSLRLLGADSTDVAEFHSLLGAGDARRALALVRGMPLADVDDEGGQLHARRSQLVATIAAARLTGLEHEIDAGERLAEVTAELEALVAAEPLDEHWWALLMTALARRGRQADALRTFQAARRTLIDELGIEPGPELRELERRLLDQDPALLGAPDPALRPGPRTAALPERLTSVIGRRQVLDELADDIAVHRLVTLLGPGGAGKTTLAMELVRRSPTATAFVTLAPVEDPDAVPGAVAAAVGLSIEVPLGQQVLPLVQRLADALSGAPALLVVDNCEHVIEPAAKLVHELLERCAGLTVLTTSREALGVPGEVLRPIPALAAGDAVELFVERARAASADLPIDDADRRTIAKICERLDRSPLAIELAAARTRTLDLDDVLRRIDDRFSLLAGGPRTVEPRQQSLRAVVDWSHDLLDADERAVFRRFATFSGGATVAAAEAVCADDPTVDEPSAGGPSAGEPAISPHAVAGIVQRLVDKSLLAVMRRPASSRLWMLQTLRDYADERLLESGEAEAVRMRHARHVARLVQPALRGLIGGEQAMWLERLAAERDNIRTALDTAVARGDGQLALSIVTPISWWFYMSGQIEVGATMLEEALGCPGADSPADRALALAQHSWLLANGPSLERAREASTEALVTAVTADDPFVEAFVHIARMMVMFFSGWIDEVRRLLPLGEDAAARAGDEWIDALMAIVRGELAGLDGESIKAEREYRAAIGRFEEVGDLFGLSLSLTEAAEIAELRGDYDDAVAMLRRGLELSEQVGFSGTPIATRARLANVEVLRGNLETAERMHRGVLADLGANTMPWVQSLAAVGLAAIARRTGRPERAKEMVDVAWSHAEGRDVPTMRAVVLVAKAYTADLAGDAATARSAAEEALAFARVLPAARQLANALEGTAAAASLDPPRWPLAAEALGAADAIRRRTGGPMPPGERFDVDRVEARLVAALGADAFGAAFAAGATADLDTLVTTLLAHP